MGERMKLDDISYSRSVIKKLIYLQSPREACPWVILPKYFKYLFNVKDNDYRLVL